MEWTPEKKEEAIEIIIARISDGESLSSILKFADRTRLPSYSHFFSWIKEDADLQNKYARACEVRHELMAEDILEIADESNADVKISDDGKMYVDGEVVQRSRLRIESRKWLLSKVMPKKYGDKIDVTSDGEKLENTVTIFQLPDNGRNEDN